MLDLESENFALPSPGSSLPSSQGIDAGPGTVTFGEERDPAAAALQLISLGAIETRLLKHGEEARVLECLDRQPLQNVMLRGSICDYGLEDSRHRGSFYGCFHDHALVGVALIGHTTLLHGSQAAIIAFANVARQSPGAETRLLLVEERSAETFCRFLLGSNNSQRILRTTLEVMFALTSVKVEYQGATPLRLAEPHEAEEVSLANARGHLELNGFDPSTQDPTGFVERSRTRIQKGSVWVVRDDEGIAFKAEAARVTDEAVYLEGVLTRPDLRGTGLGSAALIDLCQRLLKRHDAVCLLADASSKRAMAFYERLGFEPITRYCLVRFGPSETK